MGARSALSRGAVVTVVSGMVVVFALATNVESVLLLVAQPACGAVIQRLRGSSEVVGGIVGGTVSAVIFVVYCYVSAFRSPEGLTTQLVWPGVLELLLVLMGMIDGAVVGFLVWVMVKDWD